LTGAPHDAGNIDAWLWFVAQRLAIDRLRKRSHEVSGFDELPAVPVMASQVDHLLQAEELQQVLEVLNELSEGQRICLKLSYFDDLSFEEIAGKANLSTEQVRSHIQNGRIQFRRRWEARADQRQSRSRSSGQEG
jgi:RNA polymerase sigma factor (sigma-70 family)